MTDLFGAPAFVPAITLWQPWASLIFSGHKHYETRSFKPPAKYMYRRIAIHAAAALPARKHISDELAELCYDAFGCGWNHSLPRGAILGTVCLGEIIPTGERAPFITADERAAGDWSPGRWAWWLWETQQLSIPLPAKGKQGWWRLPASGMEAPSGGETVEQGSTEGDSPVGSEASETPVPSSVSTEPGVE